jgi:hypothetical protein
MAGIPKRKNSRFSLLTIIKTAEKLRKLPDSLF